MAGWIIDNLHDGMNLRDAAPQILPTETQESVGLDFSVPGVIKPMREGLLTWTLPADILDARTVYLNQVKYLFTTHADGLRVTTGATTTLVDLAFTGHFKILPINDEYVIMSDGTRQRKWMPGWATTYEWGLNTPPDPVLAVGTPTTKTIDDFEVLGDYVFYIVAVTIVPAVGDTYSDGTTTYTVIRGRYNGLPGSIDGEIAVWGAAPPVSTTGILTQVVGTGDATIAYNAYAPTGGSWTITGGGAGGAIVADTTNFKAGDQSIKLICDAGNSIIATKTVALDLTYFTTPGDAVQYMAILLSFFAQNLANVGTIILRLSCATDGLFNSDYYQMTVTLGGYSGVQLVQSGIGIVASVQSAVQAPTTTPFVISGDVPPGDTPTQKKYDLQTILAGVTSATSLAWTDLNMLVTDFLRVGTAIGRDWSTITGIQIEMAAINGQAQVSFDSWLLGGGNLFGSYWVAVAYQNELGNYGPYSNYVGPITVTAQPLGISGLTPDTDPQTRWRRLAILGGSLNQPMVAYLENNIDSTMNYDQTEASLVEVENYFNNKKPPTCVDMVSWAGRIWMVNGDNTLRFSEPLLFEGFPLQNQLILTEGEQLRQVAVMGSYIASRGKDREHLTQLTGDTPAYWQTVLGAKQGAVSSRLLLTDISGGQVYSSKLGFYISDTYYLPKINPVITDFTKVFGDMIGDRAYLAFTDKDGVPRVMRIDYRLGKAVAHYVGNFTPSTIFADQIEGKVYYALAAEIYEFDAGTNPLPTKLVIPEQLCKTTALKDFFSLDYLLTGGPLNTAMILDGVSLPASLVWPNADRRHDPVSLPQGTVGSQLGFTLTTTTEDFVLICPLEMDQVPV